MTDFRTRCKSILKSACPLWLFFLAYNFLLFYFSLLPGNELAPLLINWNDKLLHFCGYAVLFLVTYRAFLLGRYKPLRENALLWAFCWAINVAAITELLQHFVAGRFTDAYDLAANGAGVISALLFSRLRAACGPKPDKSVNGY